MKGDIPEAALRLQRLAKEIRTHTSPQKVWGDPNESRDPYGCRRIIPVERVRNARTK